MAALVPLSRLHRDLLAAEVISGPPVYVRRKVYYTGHATTTYSIEQASTLIDFIGSKTGSEDCLPFAVRLVEGGEMISIAEDNGEFACGDILKSCLTKVEGFNVLVCVSRHVDGMFVTDMLQPQKLRAVKEAAAKVLELLKEHLTNASKKTTAPSQQQQLLQPRDSFCLDSAQLLPLGVSGMLPAVAPAVPNKPLSAAPKEGDLQQWKVDC